MLASMLLHVVPMTPKVHILTYGSTRWQGFGGMVNTVKSLALNGRNRDEVKGTIVPQSDGWPPPEFVSHKIVKLGREVTVETCPPERAPSQQSRLTSLGKQEKFPC